MDHFILEESLNHDKKDTPKFGDKHHHHHFHHMPGKGNTHGAGATFTSAAAVEEESKVVVHQMCSRHSFGEETVNYKFLFKNDKERGRFLEAYERAVMLFNKG
jgi:hypothetical protein